MGILNFFRSLAQDESLHTSDSASNDDEKILSQNLQEKYATILMLNAYGKGNPLPPAYPLFYERECGITNPKLFHSILIKQGYFEEASPTDILSNFKVEELKQILDSAGLKKTGKKDDLIARIVSEIDTDTLTAFFPKNKYYSLSKKGNDLLDQNKDYVELHKRATWMIPLIEYEQHRIKSANNDFYDIAFEIFNERLAKNESDFSNRLSFLCISQIQEIKGQLKESLYALLFVLYYDINSKQLYPPVDHFATTRMSKKEFKECYPIRLFAPGIISSIAKLQLYYSDEMTNQIYCQNIIKKPICSKEIFKEILFDIFNNAIFPHDKWNQYFEKIFYKSIRW